MYSPYPSSILPQEDTYWQVLHSIGSKAVRAIVGRASKHLIKYFKDCINLHKCQ